MNTTLDRRRLVWALVGVVLALGGVVVGFATASKASWLLPYAGVCCVFVAMDDHRVEREAAARRVSLARVAVLSLLGAACPTVLGFVGHWSVGQLWLPTWPGHLLPTLGFFSFMPLSGFVAMSIPYALMKGLRRDWAHVSGAVIVGVAAVLGLVLLFGTSAHAMRLRVRGYGRLAEEVAPIVAAIQRFEAERGQAPAALQDLVPAYIPALPSWTSRLGYHRAGVKRRELFENPWILRVNARFAMGFDSFVYFPRQNYPEYMYGGGPERVGAWVYVHE